MGAMNAKYGSELHLLRWLGRHRVEFNEKVRQATGGLIVDRWLDFPFSKGTKSYDSEWKGVSFLPEGVQHHLDAVFPERWRSSMSWDAVGLATDGTWILVEAKAHVGELKTQHKERKDIQLIRERLFDVAEKLGGIPENWTKEYYQAANRIFVQKVLSEEVKSVQLNVFFCGDRRRGVICPRGKSRWEAEIRKEYAALGLSEDNSFVSTHVKNLFLHVNSVDAV